MAVDKYQACQGRLAESESGNRVGAQTVPPGFEYRFEGQFGYGRDVGEPPILVLESRESEFRKARDTRLAQAENPGRLLGFLFKTLELCQTRVGFFHSRVLQHPIHSPSNGAGLSIRGLIWR